MRKCNISGFLEQAVYSVQSSLSERVNLTFFSPSGSFASASSPIPNHASWVIPDPTLSDQTEKCKTSHQKKVTIRRIYDRSLGRTQISYREWTRTVTGSGTCTMAMGAMTATGNAVAENVSIHHVCRKYTVNGRISYILCVYNRFREQQPITPSESSHVTPTTANLENEQKQQSEFDLQTGESNKSIFTRTFLDINHFGCSN